MMILINSIWQIQYSVISLFLFHIWVKDTSFQLHVTIQIIIIYWLFAPHNLVRRCTLTERIALSLIWHVVYFLLIKKAPFRHQISKVIDGMLFMHCKRNSCVTYSCVNNIKIERDYKWLINIHLIKVFFMSIILPIYG